MSKLSGILISCFFTILLTYTLFVSHSEGQITFGGGGGGGGGGGVTGWPTVSTTKVITWANSLANAVRIGDGTTPMCFYTDATLGPVIRPCTDSNTRTYIWTDFTWSLFDIEGNTDILTVDPDAASPKGIYTFGTNYKPLKSIWFDAASLSVDGTQCATPTEVTLGSNPKTFTIICLENDAASMYGKVKMPDAWDGGTITLEVVYVQTAADTGTIKLDVGAQCRGTGEAISTWGTEVDLDSTGTGSSKNDFSTSGAITPAGTCAASDMLYFRAQVDATSNPTTAAATLNFLGFKMEYGVTSISD